MNWGEGCYRPDSAGVYLRIDNEHFRDWVARAMASDPSSQRASLAVAWVAPIAGIAAVTGIAAIAWVSAVTGIAAIFIFFILGSGSRNSHFVVH